MSPKVPTGLAAIGRAERVAAVLDQIQVVLFAERHHRVEVERIAQRVGDHDGAGLVADRASSSIERRTL